MFFYRSSFLGTILTIKCKKGEATFLSDNASALAILQEVISKQATHQKIRINISHSA